MRTDYFSDLLPEFVTSVTTAKPKLVTPENHGNASNINEIEKALPLLPVLPRKTAITAQRGRAVSVFDYKLADKPDTWLVLIAPGCDLKEATRTCRLMFGADRVLAVRNRSN